jgi:hypothetical protein
MSLENIETNLEKSLDINCLVSNLSLEFEDKLSEEDKKFGLFHVNASSVYKDSELSEVLPNKIIYPDERKWSVILSHDVDMIPDLFSTVKKALEIEKKYNVTSTYLLASLKSLDTRHEHDPTYVLESNMTKELIYLIAANNHEIGIHGSFDSYNDIGLLKEEKRRLEDFVGMEIKSIRQHFLNFDRMKTPFIQDDLGFAIDSSLGFPSDVGVRTGYNAPLHFYDTKKSTNIDLLTIPYLIMDQNILWNEALENSSYEDKLQYLIMLLDKAKKDGAPIILDWHLHTIELDEWWDIYDDILKYISQDESCAVMNMEQFYYSYSLLN